jgi:heptosyltransferase III
MTAKKPTSWSGLRGALRRVTRRHHRQHRLQLWLSLARNRRYLLKLKRRITSAKAGRKLIGIALVEHIGDIVACEPISRYLRKQNPDACIVWCLRAPYKEVVKHNPDVDHVVTVACVSEWMRLAEAEIFDETFDLHFTRRVCRYCGVPVKKTRGDSAIAIDNYYEYGNLLEAYCLSTGLPRMGEGPRLYVSESDRRFADGLNLPEKFAAIHCLTNEAERNWAQPKWNQLVEWMIRDQGLPVVEIGLERHVVFEGKHYTNLCGKVSLLQTGEIIRRARVYVGVDSGPAHFANALGTPGVILLGRYRSFKRYCPFSGGYANGDNAELVYSDGPASDIPVAQVTAAISRRLAIKNSGRSLVDSVREETCCSQGTN